MKSRLARTPRWAPGRLFVIPLDGGGFGLCQSLSNLMENVIDCAFFDTRYPQAPTDISDTNQLFTIAVLSTWKRSINKGEWKHVGEAAFAIDPERSPNYQIVRNANGVGLKTYDSGIINEFLSAYHGMAPWNIWKDPDYLDQLLFDGVRRPGTAIILSEAERIAYRREHGWE